MGTREPQVPQGAGFVCVFNRDRDNYQVALGLHEAGLLDALVTDFYAPRRLRPILPRFLARKHDNALPGQMVSRDLVAFASQYAAQVAKRPMERVWPWVDARLGRTARKVAKRHSGNIYAYHQYLPPTIAQSAKLIGFVFHPLPQFYLPKLEEDARQFPEARSSYELEVRAHRNFSLAETWQRMDAVVCTSQFTAKTVIASGVDEDKISVIPYGLPARDVKPATAVEGTGSPTFLFVGQGVQRKGLHHLIRAWQASGMGNARLRIVSYRIDPDIAAEIDDPSIELLGYQDRESIEQLMSDADVFVMPSLVEGFGLVYLEALAHGCHVIGTANTGLPDIDVGPGSKTLVPTGDPAALGEALHDLAERARSGALDRVEIAREGGNWTQADFRRAIGDHARAVLSEGATTG
ncbi:glycosyltransferase family 4 protein [Qipengyuania gaetbuli]|uniref:glycosyltransferase family 4 protein n=1 Tax=Qipengyuania gaetbuli TaxID=266952 RepID=UPI001CFE2AE9|nr:glycosyltransferase family 4 protein [Qipengyuania gaetbuli]